MMQDNLYYVGCFKIHSVITIVPSRTEGLAVNSRPGMNNIELWITLPYNNITNKYLNVPSTCYDRVLPSVYPSTTLSCGGSACSGSQDSLPIYPSAALHPH